ncbi:hypothetical protein QQZ08_007172 [Neonectria magnoliae]|uniref:Meiosis-specific nuclear structural protein 1 n=1 Tax=Neonectria magnoliae TaxID=2732573 RepID=A0ABR1HZQ4_9HYPO
MGKLADKAKVLTFYRKEKLVRHEKERLQQELATSQLERQNQEERVQDELTLYKQEIRADLEKEIREELESDLANRQMESRWRTKLFIVLCIS